MLSQVSPELVAQFVSPPMRGCPPLPPCLGVDLMGCNGDENEAVLMGFPSLLNINFAVALVPSFCHRGWWNESHFPVTSR